ncbi:MAG: substrate-binding domain-containing protein [Clostridiaceae bacterium]
MKENITMQDIADRLNVSKVTVSKALADKEGVSEELKEKIKKLSDEMGYRYNTAAKSIKNGCSYNIGVLVAHRFVSGTPSFYLSFYQAIAMELEKRGYYGILQVLQTEDEEQLNLPRVYYEKKVDGFIILGQINKEYIDLLKTIDIPAVFLDFYDEHDEFDSVVMDNFFSAYEITNYLFKLGHRNIAYVGDIYATSSIQDRFLGYYKSFLEHRMPLKEENIINDRDENGKFVKLDLPKNMPDAFVCNNDDVAYNLINTLKDKGYKVPEDISVVAFDNTIYATISNPQITCIEVNVEEMARRAVKHIINRINKKSFTNGRFFIKGKIIYRDSVKEKKQG